jgi:hypothetical protein
MLESAIVIYSTLMFVVTSAYLACCKKDNLAPDDTDAHSYIINFQPNVSTSPSRPPGPFVYSIRIEDDEYDSFPSSEPPPVNSPPSPKSPDVDNSTEVCAMCIMPFYERERVIWLPCAHKFHTTNDCNLISEWISKHNSCPICMIPVNKCGSELLT